MNPTGPADDAWRQGRLGFRTDWNPGKAKDDHVTVEGDYYLGDSGGITNLVSPLPPFVDSLATQDRVNGQNVLARWQHVCGEDSDWTLQTYFDRYERDRIFGSETVNTFDVDFQYRFPLGERQKITCGAGFRDIREDLPTDDPFFLHFTPVDQTLNFTSQFVQDEIALVDDLLSLTLGTKLEQNPYTGLEVQPTARLLWTPDNQHSFWGAVSRGVRTPFRAERDIAVTGFREPGVFSRILGSNSVESEALMAYEIGYREQTTERFSWDVAVFYNVYDDLVTGVPGQPFFEGVPPPQHMILPVTFANGPGADTYGVEWSATWALSQAWRVSGHYTYFHLRSLDPTHNGEGMDPHNQAYLRSAWDLGRRLEFDLIGRYVDELPALHVPSYLTMDMRLGWRPREDLELAVVGQNLLQSHHVEFGAVSLDPITEVTEVPRGVYGMITWRY